MGRKTIKHAFSMFYTLIKHRFLTNQSARKILSILYVYIYIKINENQSLPFLCFCAKRFTAGAALQA